MDEPQTIQQPEPARKSGGNWLLGCGAGCAVLLIVAVLGGIVAYKLSLRSAEIKREELREVMVMEYAALKAAGLIPEERLEFFEAAVADSQRPDVGIFGLLLYIGGIIEPVKDGELTEEEQILAEQTQAFLLQDPAPGPMAFGDFIQERPRLQRIIEDMAAR